MNVKQALDKLILVNDRYLKNKPEEMGSGWDVATYFMGCMEAYKLTGKKEYIDTVLKWCELNEWGPRKQPADYAEKILVNHFTVEGKLDWQYENPEDYLNVHADYVCCGRTYLEVMKLFPEIGTFDKVKKILDFNVADPHVDYWWWVDTIHMALAVYHQTSLMTGDSRYAEKAHALYLDMKERRGYYDKEDHLWFRDMKYTPDVMRSRNHKKVFWSRGNGWVYAGLIQTMEVIGKDSEYYAEYEKVFLDMTEALIRTRSADGLWRSNLDDPEDYPSPETSGTLLFLHSMIKAVRLGVLDESYVKIFTESFDAITKLAVFEDGFLGWVQGVEQKPGSVYPDTTHTYAVGYYILTCCEWIKYCREKGIE
ncbi:MAG: glycoside hydrolase family 88 protein [Clostridia bacterium]|nr:glycoside hydrolase family 88 protein [Clostridia bacterium]